MTIKEMRKQLGDTQMDFSERYEIPLRTIQNWESGVRVPPKYVEEFLKLRVQTDLVNRRTIKLPVYDPAKKNLPTRSDYVGAHSWLHAIASKLGEETVFALDEALMCDDSFLGRNEEYLVWVYGDDSLSKYNGVVVLGNTISPLDVRVTQGLRYTAFHRTVNDAMANENILDMQGITEALSSYYFKHNESFEGLAIAPEYQNRFESLAQDAVDYYSY